MSDKTRTSIDPRGATIEAIDDMEVIQLTQVWQKLDIPAYCVAKIQNVSYGEGKRARLYVSKTPPFTLDDGFYLKPDNYFDLSTGDKSIYVRSDDGAKIGYIYTKVSIGSIEYKQDIEQFTEVIGTTPKEIVCDKGLYFIIQNIEPEDSDKMITFSVRTKNNLNDGFTLHATKFIGIPIMVDATIRIFAAEDTKITYVLMPPSSTNTGISKELEEKLNYYFGLIDVINHTYVNKETLKGYLDTYWHEMQEYMSFNLALKVDKHEFYKFVQDALMLFVEFAGSLQELDDRVEKYKVELSTEDHRLDTVKFERKTPLHLWGGLQGNSDFMADRIDIKLDLDDYCFVLPTKEIPDPDNPGQTIIIEDEEGKLSLLKSSMTNKRDPDEDKLVTQGIALELDKDIQSRVKREGDYFTNLIGMQKEQVFFNRDKKYIKILNLQNIPIFDISSQRCELDFTNFNSIKGNNFVGKISVELSLTSNRIKSKVLVNINLTDNDPDMDKLIDVNVLYITTNINQFEEYDTFILIADDNKKHIGIDHNDLQKAKVEIKSVTYYDLDDNTFDLISNIPNTWILPLSSDNHQLIKDEFLKPIKLINYSVHPGIAIRIGGATPADYFDGYTNFSGVTFLNEGLRSISLDSHRLDGVSGEYYFNTQKHYYNDSIEKLKVDINGLSYTRPGSPGLVHPVKKGVTAEFIKNILNNVIDNDGHRHTNVDYIHDGFMSKEDKLDLDIMKSIIQMENEIIFDLKTRLEDVKTNYNIFRLKADNNENYYFLSRNHKVYFFRENNEKIFLNEESLDYACDYNPNISTKDFKFGNIIPMRKLQPECVNANLLMNQRTSIVKYLHINNDYFNSNSNVATQLVSNNNTIQYETFDTDGNVVTKNIILDSSRKNIITDDFILSPRISDNLNSNGKYLFISPTSNTVKDKITINLPEDITNGTYVLRINNNFGIFGKYITTSYFDNLIADGFNIDILPSNDKITIDIQNSIYSMKLYRIPLNKFIDDSITFDQTIIINSLKEYFQEYKTISDFDHFHSEANFRDLFLIDDNSSDESIAQMWTFRGEFFTNVPQDSLQKYIYPIRNIGRDILCYTTFNINNYGGYIEDNMKYIKLKDINSPYNLSTLTCKGIEEVRKNYPDAFIDLTSYNPRNIADFIFTMTEGGDE